MIATARPQRSLQRWLRSTSNRTFVVWPVALLALQALIDRGWPPLPLLLRSWPAGAVFLAHAIWFDRRVRADESGLRVLFGPAYRDDQGRVGRWIPGVG